LWWKGLGRYKNGKPNQEISLEEFQRALSKGHYANLYLHRAYLAVIFWIGCRRSEPLMMLKEDIREEKGSLFLKIPALKHGMRGGEIELPLSYPGVDYILKRWQQIKPGRRMFPFTDKTGYRIIKRIFTDKSPHWFRHSRITMLRRLRDQKILSTDDIKSWTGIKADRTIEGYGLRSQEGIHKVAAALMKD